MSRWEVSGTVSSMAYNAFTLDRLRDQCKLTLRERQGLFAGVKPVAISSLVRQNLDDGAPMAIAMSTEKARSEFIVAPILMEVWRQCGGRVGLFSGMEFSVDPEHGLTGYCDFLMTASSSQIDIQAPVLAVVEAKNDNIRSGIPQCIAEMHAAVLFNDRKGQPKRVVYGAVTTGSLWTFLQLHGVEVEVDLDEYYLREVERIVGILVHMVASPAPPSGPSPRLLTQQLPDQ